MLERRATLVEQPGHLDARISQVATETICGDRDSDQLDAFDDDDRASRSGSRTILMMLAAVAIRAADHHEDARRPRDQGRGPS